MTATYIPTNLGNIGSQSFTRSAATVHAMDSVMVDGSGNVVPSLPRKVVVTPTVDTNAYAVGDVFFTTTAITSAMLNADQSGLVVGAKLQVKSDVAFGVRIIFMNANTSIGTFNVPPSASDTDGESQGHHFDLNQSGQIDMGAYRMMNATGLYIPVYPASGTTTLYVAAVLIEVTTTVTVAASSCILTLDII